MKKILAILLTLGMIFMLVACGNNKGVSSNNSNNNSGDISSTDSSNITSSNTQSNEHTSSTTHSNTSNGPTSSNTSSNKPSSSSATSSKPTVNTFLPTGDTFTLGNQKYSLSFFDDFNGTKLDTTKWDYCPEWQRGDVGGKWDDDMVTLDGNGLLHLNVGYKNGNLVSGGIRTITKNYRNLFTQSRGYFEIRCKLQSVPGFWSAFWLLGGNMNDNNSDNSAIDGVEIDIFESFDLKNGVINHALHYDGYSTNHKSVGRETRDPSLYDGEFHKFALLWNEEGYYFYIDGIQTNKIDKRNLDFPGSFTGEAYMKITTECGTWAGTIDKNKLPDALVVDYVRVYKEID